MTFAHSPLHQALETTRMLVENILSHQQEDREMLCNGKFIKVFGTLAIVVVTSNNRKEFRLMGSMLSRNPYQKAVPLDDDHALLLLDGIEERAKRLHAESLERDLAQIAKVKAILKGESCERKD
ncbi:MAG TPA: hypothetical protein VJJ02_01440 [Candidatus Paceibacterota bacterium]